MEAMKSMAKSVGAEAESSLTWCGRNRALAFWFLAFAVFLGACGCSPVGYLPLDRLTYEDLSAAYAHTQLRTSSTLDVLGMFRSPEYKLQPNLVGMELLSQSDTIVASCGKSKDAYKTWFSMVAFDEHRMTAQRKSFFLIDEKVTILPSDPKQYIIPPRRGLMFEYEMVFGPEVIAGPFATEEAGQIAILRQVADNVRKDVDKLNGGKGESGQGNEILAVSGMLMNQVFEAALLELSMSPALANQLGDKEGVKFKHLSFDPARIRMLVDSDIVAVKIRLGLPFF
ncbi:MAG: hypothetical protein JSU70_06995 [Phycisphaerales bacterium]|nr:MAG: hypothetical protein JSU70_06995 [Phycisphaerales bacterium]